MATALTAWLIAAAPMACTSARPRSRTMPAMAPATSVGRDEAETFNALTSSLRRTAEAAGAATLATETDGNWLTMVSPEGLAPAGRGPGEAASRGRDYRTIAPPLVHTVPVCTLAIGPRSKV